MMGFFYIGVGEVRIIDQAELLGDFCKKNNVWMIWISDNSDPDNSDDINLHRTFVTMLENYANKHFSDSERESKTTDLMFAQFVLFDTQEEAYEFYYDIFENTILYASCFYAQLYSPIEGIIDENT